MTVYPDLAFLLGILFHGAVFRLTLLLVDLHRPWWLFWLSVFVSGISSAVILIPSIPIFISFMVSLLFPVFLFRGKTLWGTFCNFLTGIMVLICYVGLFLAFSIGLFRPILVFGTSGGYFILPFLSCVISAILSYFVGLVFVRIRTKQKGKQCCDCNLLLDGVRMSFRAYVDTGNFLTDPLSGLPVAIVEFSVLRNGFGADFPLPMTYEFGERFSSRIRVIPYRSVSGDSRMLSGVVPDRFTVNGVERKVVVAILDQKLESRGRFSAIIGSDITGGD